MGLDLPLTFFLADEWFTVDGSTSIGIPFYLASLTLTAVDAYVMGEAPEGSRRGEFMRVLRHEVGHAVLHAFAVARRPDFRKLFGNPAKRYSPDRYRYRKGHPDFVENLSEGYGQSHPEEDFAETLAAVLGFSAELLNRRYRRGTLARAKLDYVRRLLRRVAAGELRASRAATKPHILGKADSMRRTLASYYRWRRGEIARRRVVTDSL